MKCRCSRSHTCALHRAVLTPPQRALAGPADRRDRKRRDMAGGGSKVEHPLNSSGAP